MTPFYKIVVSKKCYRGMRTKRQIPDYCDGADNHYNRKQTPRGFFPRGVWLQNYTGNRSKTRGTAVKNLITNLLSRQ